VAKLGEALLGAAQEGEPAMELRLVDRLLTWPEILGQRLFATRIPLKGPLECYYSGRIPTRQIPRARPHRLAYAY